MPKRTESTWFSCLLEIVGVRDMAEEDSDEYVFRTSIFRDKVGQIAKQPKFSESSDSGASLLYAVWLDKCYVICRDAKLLLEYLQMLRTELLTPTQCVLFRAVVSEGKAFERTNVLSTNFLTVAATLEGQLQHLKAIAIAVDSEVRDALLKNSKSVAWCNNAMFSNVALSGTRSDRLERIYDLSLNGTDVTKEAIDDFFILFREATQRSKKAGRFFVPLIINVGRSLPETHDGRKVLDRLMDHLVDGNSQHNLKSTTNAELAYFGLLDRYYSVRDKNSSEEGKVFWDAFEDRFLNYFVKHSRWLKARLQKEHKSGDIPPYILRAPARGRLTKLFAGLPEDVAEPTSE